MTRQQRTSRRGHRRAIEVMVIIFAVDARRRKRRRTSRRVSDDTSRALGRPGEGDVSRARRGIDTCTRAWPRSTTPVGRKRGVGDASEEEGTQEYIWVVDLCRDKGSWSLHRWSQICGEGMCLLSYLMLVSRYPEDVLQGL